MHEKFWCVCLLAITAVTGGAEFYGSYATHSNSIWGEAIHLIADGLPFLGVLCILSKLYLEEQEDMIEFAIRGFNRIFLFFGGLYLCIASLERFDHPQAIDSLAVAYATFGLIGNAVQAAIAHFKLAHVYHHSDTQRTQMLHLFYDIAASAVVVLVALLIAITGQLVWDALLSFMLGIFTMFAGIVGGHAHGTGHAEACAHHH